MADCPVEEGELSYNIIFERNFSYENDVAGFAINSDSHHVVYRNNVAWRNGADWAGRGSSSGFLCYESCWHVERTTSTTVLFRRATSLWSRSLWIPRNVPPPPFPFVEDRAVDATGVTITSTIPNSTTTPYLTKLTSL